MDRRMGTKSREVETQNVRTTCLDVERLLSQVRTLYEGWKDQVNFLNLDQYKILNQVRIGRDTYENDGMIVEIFQILNKKIRG